ncbi:MAG TPA: histidine phosphatase family protein [Ktedonobacterales bacterium]
MTHLYLIRHGEAYSNVERDGNGNVPGLRGDKGLTPRGRAQAERLRDRLAKTGEIRPDMLLASTFARAWQTAEIVAPALGLPIIPDDDLQEMRPGEADGMTERELLERYTIPDYRETPYARLAPGAENWGEFILRVGSMLDRVTREYAGKTVVLVTHGGVIDASIIVFFQVHSLKVPPFALYTHNTSITEWELEQSDGFRERPEGAARWRLVRYNDDYHIRDLPDVGLSPETSAAHAMEDGES